MTKSFVCIMKKRMVARVLIVCVETQGTEGYQDLLYSAALTKLFPFYYKGG